MRLFRCLCFVCCLSFGGVLSAAPVPAVVPSSFDFDALPIAQLVRLVYLQAYPDVAYTLDPVLLQDQRPVSFRWKSGGKSEFRTFFSQFLFSLGYEISSKSGADVISVKKPVQKSSSLLDDPNQEVFIYSPKYRDASYLTDLLSPLFGGQFVNQKRLGIDAPGSSSSQPGASPSGDAVTPGTLLDQANRKLDRVTFVGTSREVATLKKLIDQVDTPVGEVLVKAYMYEVGSSGSDASALSLVISALGGRFGLSVGGDPLSNLVRLKTGSIDAVASALASDSRFKVVTSPYQRVRSGKSARLVSGSQVSVLGAVVSNTNGSTQQSYDRVESGTILEISPVVREEVIDVDFFQQVSSFVKSDVSAQPTLNKRELRSTLTLHDGEVVLIAGLDNTQNEDAKSGLPFLPFSLSKSRSSSKSQLLLILELRKL